MLRLVSGDVAAEDRWAEAQSLLDGVPDESVEQRLRRRRRHLVLAVVAVVLLTTAAVAAAVVLSDGRGHVSEDVPTWQVVTGFSISGAGLVFQIVGLVIVVRANRRSRGRFSPLSVLSRAQRKELLAQVRGVRAADPIRTPLARRVAEQLLRQRTIVVINLGLGINFLGQWIAQPEIWRAAGAGAYLLLLGVSLVLVQRDVRRARRFLEAHPTA